MKVLITGATGFIGSHLVERLLNKGYEISCMTRNISRPGWLGGLGISLVEGDCADKDSLYRSVRGCDYIYHLAGLTKAHRKSDFYRVNTEGTENIISAAAEKNPNIKRFVYVSSLSAFGPKMNRGLPTENQVPRPVSDYGHSKLGAEKAIQKYRGTIPISILRPPVVYGPRDREFFSLFRWIGKGIAPSWGRGCTSLIYIDDAIDALLLAAEHDRAVGKTYFISDGEIHSNEDVLEEISRVLQAKPLKIRIPRYLLPRIGFFVQGISTMVGKITMINRDKCTELTYPEWVCDTEHVRKDLGFRPKTRLREGIQWTADWYRTQKWL